MALTVEDELYIRDFLNDIDFGLVNMTTLSGSASLDFGTILDGTTIALTMALLGAIPGSAIAVGAPATLEAGLTYAAVCTALNIIEIRLTYLSTGAGPTSIDPAIATWKITVFIP